MNCKYHLGYSLETSVLLPFFTRITTGCWTIDHLINTLLPVLKVQQFDATL
jgi:hypothetical protein